MIARKIICTGLTIVVLLMSLSACAKSTPPAETATPTVAEATITDSPTETEAPTNTLAPTATAQAQATQDGAASGTITPTVAAQTPVPGKPASSTTDKYQYLGQSIADRTQLRPNTAVTITWTVKNVGTTGWTTDYTLRYFSGPKPLKDAYKFSKVVGADKTIDLVASFTTPADLGDYDLWFKLVNADGQNFGDVDFVFTVTNSPKAFTATPKK